MKIRMNTLAEEKKRIKHLIQSRLWILTVKVTTAQNADSAEIKSARIAH